MHIEGIEIVEGISMRNTPQLYYERIEATVKANLSRLNVVKSIVFERAVNTNSIYLKIRFKECRNQLVVSIRTHEPRLYREGYIYIYSFEYDSVNQMVEEIAKKIKKNYRDQEAELRKMKYESKRQSLRKKKRKRKSTPARLMSSPTRRSAKEIRAQDLVVQRLINEINRKKDIDTNTGNRSRKDYAASEQHFDKNQEAI